MANQDMIKVSVCVVTYNQEEYIAECLQSLVEQETDFPFEIIVSDDCSTDRTPLIIERYAKKYPGLIKPIFHKKNIGAYQNFWFAHQLACGEYIAHMDGDDYALPGKLKNQAEFLDKNPDCNIVWTPVKVKHKDGTFSSKSEDVLKVIFNKRFYRKDIIQYISVGVNSSKMYRKKCRDFKLPDFELVDYFANVEQVGDGYAAYSSIRPLGIYRAGIGIASSSSKTREILCNCFLFFNGKYPEYRKQVNAAALTYFLMDLKNLRPTAKMFLKVYLKTFTIKSFFEFVVGFKVIRMLKV